MGYGVIEDNSSEFLGIGLSWDLLMERK